MTRYTRQHISHGKCKAIVGQPSTDHGSGVTFGRLSARRLPNPKGETGEPGGQSGRVIGKEGKKNKKANSHFQLQVDAMEPQSARVKTWNGVSLPKGRTFTGRQRKTADAKA